MLGLGQFIVRHPISTLEVDKKLKGRLKVDNKFNMAQIIFMQGGHKEVQLARL